MNEQNKIHSRFAKSAIGMSAKFASKMTFALALIFSFMSSVAQAQEMYDFYTGVRQLGMGGAYTAVVNDETALLTNPAGLGKIRDWTFTIADPELHGSFNNTAIAKLDKIGSVFSVQGLMDTLKEAKGEHWHAKAQVFPSIVGPNFGLGLHMKYAIDAEVNDAGDSFRLDYTNDYALALGHNLRLFSGILKVGTGLRLVNRIEIRKDIPTTQTDLNVATMASEGLGLAVDLGVNVAIPVAAIPTFSVVVHDIGNTAYTMGDGMMYPSETRPEHTKQRVDMGVAVFPILSNHTRATFTVEYHDLLQSVPDKDAMKRLHVGAEMNFADFFFLRAGMNQRYWTAGVELASERFQLQVATYGEEIGAPVNDTVTPREDRRFVGKFGFRF